MLYMGAHDSQLAPYAELNLQAILAAERSPYVQVLLQIERHGESERWQINHSGYPVRQIIEAADVTDPASLTSFLLWAKSLSTDHHRALVLWGHGDGWDQDIWQPEITTRTEPTVQPFGMFGGSNSNGTRAMLANHRISQAINDADLSLSVLGFDGCSMATLETLYEYSDNAHYLIASQHLIPLQGWNYFDLLSMMAAEYPDSAQHWIQQVLQTYRTQYKSVPGQWSMSAFSSQGIGSIHLALNDWSTRQLAQSLQSDTVQADVIARLYDARHSSPLSVINPINPHVYVDIRQLFGKLALDDEPIRNALDEARVGYYANGAAGQQDLSGLSLVFYSMPIAEESNVLNQNYRDYDEVTGRGNRGDFFSRNAWPEVFWLYADTF